MRQTIQHTLWVFDAGVRDFRFKSIPGAIGMLNALYLSNCIGDTGANFTVQSAVAMLAPGRMIAPQRFDAVVFLVRDPSQSLIAKTGGDIMEPSNNPKAAGFTVAGNSAVAGLAEVYWDRCFNNSEVAASIFHEAAHLKSGLGRSMHTQTVGAPHGGPGLRVLSDQGSSKGFPSEDDLDFYADAITKPITVRSLVP